MIKILPFLALPLLAFAAGREPELRIISPAKGASVTAGQDLTIDIWTAKDGIAMILVMLGGMPIEAKHVSGPPPYRFSVRVPPAARLGLSELAVMARVAGPLSLLSYPVVVDVERADPPQTIRVSPASLALHYIGDRNQIQVMGSYAGEGEVDISKSTRLTYESENPGIASVSSEGTVTGVSSGSTRIRVNRQFSVDVRVAGIVVPLHQH